MNEFVIKINKEEFLKILSDYLSTENCKKIEVKEKNMIITRNSPYGADRYVDVIFYSEETIEVLGHKAIRTVTLTEEEIEDILNNLLQKENFKVTKFRLRTKIDEKFDGREYDYFSNFEGVEINIDKLVKTYQKERCKYEKV